MKELLALRRKGPNIDINKVATNAIKANAVSAVLSTAAAFVMACLQCKKVFDES